MPLIFRVFYCVALLTLMRPAPARGQLQHLAKRAPSVTNALVIVDRKAVVASPLAVQEQWGEQIREAHRAGAIAVPPQAELFLMAAEIDYEFMQPIWEVAAAYLSERVTMDDVAARTGGRLDRLAGLDAVERPNDSFVVAFGPRLVGAMAPANRQQVMRWARQSRSKREPDVGPFLAEAVAAASKPANQIVVAFDLAGLLAVGEVAAALADSKALADAGLGHQEAAAALAAIVGVRLEVEVDAAINGRLHLVFEENPKSLEAVARPLLEEILSARGAKIDGLSTWKTEAQDNSLLLTGKMSASGLRRVLSILSGPVGPWVSDYPDGESDADQMAEMSRNYFQAVIGYLNDLFFNDSAQLQSLQQVEVWVERYARKIEDLDANGVDPDVVNYAESVVMGLREISTVMRRAQQRTDLREATMMGSGRARYGKYGAYGRFEKGYVTRDRQVIQADEASRGIEDSQVIVEQLQALSAQTRASMSQRYGIEF